MGEKQTAVATKRGGRARVAAPALVADGPSGAPAPRITGKVEVVRLDRVRPNPWNPNRMTEFQVESTREGMRREGWLASYALLVWRTDEAGRDRNLIIDGEHRWRIGSELGFEKAPMVFLDGITEKRAKEMTIEFDNKRGKFDDVALRDLLKDIGLDDAGLAFRLGFDEDTFATLMEQTNVLPPDDFAEVTIDAKTDYTCPRCKYEWSGAPSAKKTKADKKALEPA
jgi:ParB-like chromosome segregation protein Spo0J